MIGTGATACAIALPNSVLYRLALASAAPLLFPHHLRPSLPPPHHKLITCLPLGTPRSPHPPGDCLKATVGHALGTKGGTAERRRLAAQHSVAARGPQPLSSGPLLSAPGTRQSCLRQQEGWGWGEGAHGSTSGQLRDVACTARSPICAGCHAPLPAHLHPPCSRPQAWRCSPGVGRRTQSALRQRTRGGRCGRGGAPRVQRVCWRDGCLGEPKAAAPSAHPGPCPPPSSGRRPS